MARASWIRGKLLGAGAFGSVNLAIQREQGAVFAAKSVVVDENSEASVRAIENEITLLQALDSQFVVRCLGSDWTEENGHLMRNVFLEYMPEGCLTDFMKQFTSAGALDEHLLRTYTRSVVEGIAYLHSRGIVHCDIKGKNILVGNGSVKLTDFGSAKQMKWDPANCPSGDAENSRVNCAVNGTPLWMAPEVVRQVEQGPASDIWSLGCTVVEMATGRAPWSNLEGMNQFVALYHIGCTDDLPAVPEWLSPEAHDFLSHCLERDPRRRWTSAQLLQHPFLTTRFVEDPPMCAQLLQQGPPSPTSVMQFSSDSHDSSASCFVNSVPTLAPPRKLVSAQSAQEHVEENWWNSPDGPWIVVRSPKSDASIPSSDCIISDPLPQACECEDLEEPSCEVLESVDLEQTSVMSVSAVVATFSKAHDIAGEVIQSIASSPTDFGSSMQRLSESEEDCSYATLLGLEILEFGMKEVESFVAGLSLGLAVKGYSVSSEYSVLVNQYSNPQILLYWWLCYRGWGSHWKCGRLDQCVTLQLLDKCTFALILKTICSLALVKLCVFSFDIFCGFG